MSNRPPRMPREYYVGEQTVAFTAVTDRRLRIFSKAETIAPLVERLGVAAKKFDCVIPIYCFMPDHLHVMFTGLRDHSDTLAAMTRFKLLSGLWFERKKLDGWQGSFHDHVVMGHRDWRSHARYIANNPIRWGLATDPFEYSFTGTIGCDLQDVILGLP
jgi:putative transposase